VQGQQRSTQAATVRLRGRGGPLSVAVFWPPRSEPARRLVLTLDPDPARARALCLRTGRIVLAPTGGRVPTLADLAQVVGWVGAHGAELGAVPDAVLLTDAAVLDRLPADGWPRLDLLPDVDPGPSRSTQ